ncbi:MAG: RNA-binding transcriptional accessory protein [Deltaproteobacteria bacterium]|nr:RNA-binding transcriptional accessory protein [Deltaproteobacteria bacterium]
MANSHVFDPAPIIADELTLPRPGVDAVLALLAEGATVPFIARYRKEVTGGLDEVQIRSIEERRTYLLDLDARRQTVLTTIAEQGKLTPELEAKIRACPSKTELEDLYLPYKPKRRTRAMIARERGLEPLAKRIRAQPREGDPLAEAGTFVAADKDVLDSEAALAGARDIIAEELAEEAQIRALTRRFFFETGEMVAKATKQAKAERTKFEQYYDFSEPVAKIPSHRFLALRRGEREQMLKIKVETEAEKLLPRVEVRAHVDAGSPFYQQLKQAAAESYQRLLAPAMENDVRMELKLSADESAVEVFAENLRNLLLAAPMGGKTVLGVDPGLRTGCKCVAVDSTGTYRENTTIFLSQGEDKKARAAVDFLKLFDRHKPDAVAVGNGTGGRETEAFLRKLLAAERPDAACVVVQVSESGASIYSASDIAREEFPELDLTIRGAISIARRLQDPLAELVKLDPKSIGVGQYQHDVHQPLLARKLNEVVESCVNQVGVELNTASAPLLARVAGVGPKLAKKIVEHREGQGAFVSRRALLKVAGLGPKTYEQAAGFLRVREGTHPLDASAVHPERYKLVERIAKDLGEKLERLVGNAALADAIDVARYVGGDVGEPTLRDIIAELRKPGRDPRQSFEPPKFKEGVEELKDLSSGMKLEGIVTNVTHFGAFVDVGVHQDGLVHISQLADRFVKDPHDVVKVGDTLQVRVLEVDLERRRISLTARRDATPPKGDAAPPPSARPSERARSTGSDQRAPRQENFSNNPFVRALKK